MNPVIEITGLHCRYGEMEVVRDLTLQVPEGSIYAFLGTNGAGKTTTIKVLMNLLAPIQGTARVLDTPVANLGPRELAQIGYLSGDQKLPETLTVQDLINYSRDIYPTWDNAFCQRLTGLLSLPLNRKISHLSAGMKIKAALLISLAYHPRLLIFDEPFSGLDALVRDEFVESLLEVFSQERWTMFICSHDIAEVERLADRVGIIDQGTLCLSEPMKTLRGRFRRIDIIQPSGEVSGDPVTPKGILFEAVGATAKWIEPHFVSPDEVSEQIRRAFPEGTVFAVTPMSLREIFVAVTRQLRKDSKATI